jgi:vacuolar-type H+-ATPase subunit H
MNSGEALQALETMIREAKGVPLSASAVIPRDDALSLVLAAREALPKETEQAKEVLGEREQMLTEARTEAARIIEAAREERSKLLQKTDVVRAADKEAKKLVKSAEATASKLTHQADDYVDAKLANFEILLNKVLRTVGRGREQLQRRLDAAAEQPEPLRLEDSGEISGPIDISLDDHPRP